MSKLRIKTGFVLVFLALFGFFHSCASFPPETEDPAETAQAETARIEVPPVETAPVETLPERPELSEYIMGKGRIPGEKLALFLEQNNPQMDRSFLHALALIYIEEAALEGVNHDIAFVQMCLETGFLRFGGDVRPEQNNFAGLGAIGNGEPGLSFPDPRTGVRAQIQHLKAYGSEEPLNLELVNPRFRFVRRGSSPTIEGLAGTWAADRSYSVKIVSIMNRLYDFSYGIM